MTIECATGWERVPLPFADVHWCLRLAKLIANATSQKVDAQTPLLSATLPTSERAQIVLPPATTSGTVAITLRRPADQVWTLDKLEGKGLFAHTRSHGEVAIVNTDAELHCLLESHYTPAVERSSGRVRPDVAPLCVLTDSLKR